MRTARWGKAPDGVWAVTDQGLFAIASFAVNVMLARWMSTRDYGIFALGYALFLFITIFHTTLVSEPMLILGRRRFSSDTRGYLAVITFWTFILTLAVAFGATIVGWAASAQGVSLDPSAILAFGIATPCLLLFWLMRRSSYLMGIPVQAALTSGVYLAVTVTGIAGLAKASMLTPATAAMVLGVAGLVATIPVFARHRLPLAGAWRSTQAMKYAGAHWEYGRWSSAAMFLSWSTWAVYPTLLPVRAGLEATAAFSALMSLTMPATHVMTALTVLLLPSLAASRTREAASGMMRSVLTALIAIAVLQWILLGLFGRQVLGIAFGAGYARFATELWVIGLVPVCSAVTGVAGAAVRAREEPREIFRAQVLSSVMSLTFGIAAAWGWGVWGACVGYLVSSITGAVATVRACARQIPSGTGSLAVSAELQGEARNA